MLLKKNKLFIYTLIPTIISVFAFKMFIQNEKYSSTDLLFMSTVKNSASTVILFFLLALLYFFVITLLLKHIKKDYLVNFIKDIKSQRKVIYKLARNDLKSRFSGSFFGVFWAVISPILTIIVYWFVFQIGFKTANVKDIPFIIWFIPGIIPWFYFADAVNGATNSFVEYSYLVKKVVFNINILPFVKLLSICFVNIFFIAILFLIYLFYGVGFTIYGFQLIYYALCLAALCLGITLITSSISVFFKDTNQIISILIQFGFWLTPIVWDTGNAPEFLGRLFQLNPMVYIVEGFRDSFIYNHWFFEKPLFTCYFWALTILLFLIGMLINKKLKPHFSDVL